MTTPPCKDKGDRDSRGRALEVLLAPDEMEILVCIHVAFDVQLTAQTLGSAEEDTSFGRAVDLANGLENHVPVGAAEISGRAQTGDGVLLGVGVVDHDVRCVVDLDLGGEVLIGC